LCAQQPGINLKSRTASARSHSGSGNAAHWTAEHQSQTDCRRKLGSSCRAIAFGGWYYVNAQDEKLALSFRRQSGRLKRSASAGVPPQPGTDSFASAQEALRGAKTVPSIVDKYPRTHTADMARYFVGMLRLNWVITRRRASLQEAAKVLEFRSASLGKLALASVYRQRTRTRGYRSVEKAE